MDGEIDSTFQTQQRDLFFSGVVAEIGVNAFAVWSAIKSYAAFESGKAYPGMREIGKKIGLSQSSVSRAVGILLQAHLLRVVDAAKFKRKGQTYIARERLAVRVGGVIIYSIIIDYVPLKLRGQINRINQSLMTGDLDEEAWAQAEIIPGEGFVWDDKSKTLKHALRAAAIPARKFIDVDSCRKGEDIIAKISPLMAASCLIKK